MRFRVELITSYLKEHKMSKAEFCTRVGISRSTLYRILKSWSVPNSENDNIGKGENKKS